MKPIDHFGVYSFTADYHYDAGIKFDSADKKKAMSHLSKH